MPHPKEIFLHALLDTRATGSSALLYTPNHSRSNITHANVFDHLPVISSDAETMNVSIQFFNTLLFY
jgi:hypothetical protein